jgi:hypothetical protein
MCTEKKCGMKVSTQGPNTVSLRKALKELQTVETYIRWQVISTVYNSYLCEITEPNEQEELALLTYGEIR